MQTRIEPVFPTSTMARCVVSMCANHKAMRPLSRHIISFIPKENQLNNELVIPYGKKWEWKSIRQKQAKRKHPILYILTKWHNIQQVFVSLVYDKHSVSSYLSSLLLPLIPKKGEKTGLLWLCNIYWGLSWWPSSLLPGYLWLAMPATDWPRPPEGSKDALGEKKKTPKNDTLMEFYCRFFPPPNRSCCHPYFDLCIPWSIYAFVEGSDSSARL